jgi:hypothetical protein
MQELLAYTLELLRLLGATLRSVAPVIGILLVFQLMVLWQPLENSRSDCSSGTRRSAPPWTRNVGGSSGSTCSIGDEIR